MGAKPVSLRIKSASVNGVIYVTADVWTFDEILLGIRWNVLHIS